jgi:peroxiredoxin
VTAARYALFCFALPAALAQQPFDPVPPEASDTLRFGDRLPDFEAKDTAGRTWRLTDLRGKFTLIYIFHTFEARAVDKVDPRTRGSLHGLPELPELQRFYDEVKNSRKIQVLAFCRDYDYTHAPAYLKDRPYTFPVIADWTLVGKLFPGGGLQSRQWLVNPEGRLSYPFRAWSFGRILLEVERAAQHPPQLAGP